MKTKLITVKCDNCGSMVHVKNPSKFKKHCNKCGCLLTEEGTFTPVHKEQLPDQF